MELLLVLFLVVFALASVISLGLVAWFANRVLAKLSLQNRHLMQSLIVVSERPGALQIANAIETTERQIGTLEAETEPRPQPRRVAT